MSKTPQTPKKRKSTLNTDKAKSYLNEYTRNGFNKTAALNKVNPKATYQSNNTNCTAYHKRVTMHKGITDKFKLSDITVEYVIKNIKEELSKAPKASDRLRALELLGDFLRLWESKGVQFTQQVISKEDIAMLQLLYDRNVKGDTKGR